jgi:hypothetical protein
MTVFSDNTYPAAANFTITLASLASSTTGVGRQTTLVDNTTNKYLAAQVELKITMGTTPTANTLVYVYLIRYDNTAIADDGAGASDAGWTQINAPLLGTILCSAATSNVAYYGVFNTGFLGELGPKWGIGIVNSTGAALNSTEGNHGYSWIGINKLGT